jgi:hypothetical protein
MKKKSHSKSCVRCCQLSFELPFYEQGGAGEFNRGLDRMGIGQPAKFAKKIPGHHPLTTTYQLAPFSAKNIST